MDPGSDPIGESVLDGDDSPVFEFLPLALVTIPLTNDLLDRQTVRLLICMSVESAPRHIYRSSFLRSTAYGQWRGEVLLPRRFMHSFVF